MLHRNLDQLAMLLDIDRRRFASGTDDHDGIGTFVDMEINESAQGIQIETAIFMHGRDDGDNGSSNHDLVCKIIIRRL